MATCKSSVNSKCDLPLPGHLYFVGFHGGAFVISGLPRGGTFVNFFNQGELHIFTYNMNAHER